MSRRVLAKPCKICGTRHKPVSALEPGSPDLRRHAEMLSRSATFRGLDDMVRTAVNRVPAPVDDWLVRQLERAPAESEQAMVGSLRTALQFRVAQQ